VEAVVEEPKKKSKKLTTADVVEDDKTIADEASI